MILFIILIALVGIDIVLRVKQSAKTYSESDLVSFGNHLLSDKRRNSIETYANLKNVTDADLENWKNELLDKVD